MNVSRCEGNFRGGRVFGAIFLYTLDCLIFYCTTIEERPDFLQMLIEIETSSRILCYLSEIAKTQRSPFRGMTLTSS